MSGPVFTRNHSVRSVTVTIRFGASTIRAPLRATLYGEAGKPVYFEQTPLRAAEGMPSG